MPTVKVTKGYRYGELFRKKVIMNLSNLVIVNTDTETMGWIASVLGADISLMSFYLCIVENDEVTYKIPVLSGDIKDYVIEGKDVIGSLPVELASLANSVTVINYTPEEGMSYQSALDNKYISKYVVSEAEYAQ